MAEYQLEYCQFPHCRESANGPVSAKPGPWHATLCPERLPVGNVRISLTADSADQMAPSVLTPSPLEQWIAKRNAQDETLRELLSYCRTSAEDDIVVRNAATRAVYRDVADKLAGILDGER